jgi:ABC-type multidrug transport system ATPase subunit
MFDDLREQEPDLAILLTTHSMEEADFLCDRVAIMDRGKVLCEDSPESLKRGLETGERVELQTDRAIATEDREALAGAGVSRPRFSSATAVHFYARPGEGTGRRRVCSRTGDATSCI